MSTLVINLPVQAGGGGGGGGGDASAANQVIANSYLNQINQKLANKALRVDVVSSTIIYVGEADIGSSNASAVWKIQRIDLSSGVSITFASDLFNQVWNNRSSLTYV